MIFSVWYQIIILMLNLILDISSIIMIKYLEHGFWWRLDSFKYIFYNFSVSDSYSHMFFPLWFIFYSVSYFTLSKRIKYQMLCFISLYLWFALVNKLFSGFKSLQKFIKRNFFNCSVNTSAANLARNQR